MLFHVVIFSISEVTSRLIGCHYTILLQALQLKIYRNKISLV